MFLAWLEDAHSALLPCFGHNWQQREAWSCARTGADPAVSPLKDLALKSFYPPAQETGLRSAVGNKVPLGQATGE